MALAISKLKLKYMAWQNCKTDMINWNKITEKTASLMLDQSETALKETIETAKLISSRVDKLISIQLPIATALIVYLFNNRISTITNFLPLTALLSLIIILISLFFCHKAFRKYDIAIPGEYPENIARSEFIDNDFDDNEQYINIVLSICENIQKRLNYNNKINRKRTANSTRAVYALSFLLICPILSYFLYLVLDECHFSFLI